MNTYFIEVKTIDGNLTMIEMTNDIPTENDLINALMRGGKAFTLQNKDGSFVTFLHSNVIYVKVTRK